MLKEIRRMKGRTSCNLKDLSTLVAKQRSQTWRAWVGVPVFTLVGRAEIRRERFIGRKFNYNERGRRRRDVHVGHCYVTMDTREETKRRHDKPVSIVATLVALLAKLFPCSPLRILFFPCCWLIPRSRRIPLIATVPPSFLFVLLF